MPMNILKSTLSRDIGRYDPHSCSSFPGLGNTAITADSIFAGIGLSPPKELNSLVIIGASMWHIFFIEERGKAIRARCFE